MAAQKRLALSTRNLTKHYNDKAAVDGISIDVCEGEVFGILGPNGAGKTTFIRMLTTLVKPDGGSAEVFGRNVATESAAVRRLIGLTGQFATVDEDLTASENLVLFSKLSGLSSKAAKTRAGELLEQFSLTDAASKPLKEFSGGMRRRLDLATSLIAKPPVIFLDEPTTGLDPRTRAQMWDTIADLVAKGSTVVLTTQYLEEADRLADRIAVIDHGSVVALGTPDELKARVGGTYVELELADEQQARAALAVAQDTAGSHARFGEDARTVTLPAENTAAVTVLLTALERKGLEVVELSSKKPSLDEVFFALTGN